MGKLIIDGNSVYEIDEECMKRKEQEEWERNKSKDTEGKTIHASEESG